MGRPITCWALLFLAPFLVGCSDGLSLELGEECNADRQCVSGLCYGSRCLAPEADDDDDGLDNTTERRLRSDPFGEDSDGDGIADGLEAGGGDVPADTDLDGTPDVLESAVSDTDNDCIPNQLDADDQRPETDLAAVARLVCRHKGVCAVPATVQVVCVKSTTDGALTAVASCDYSAVANYDGNVELHCDGLDNDCDGRVDEDLGYTEAESGETRAVGESCVGQGACATATGTVECSDEGAICSINQGGSRFAGALSDADCDDEDDDCDGLTDEDVTWTSPTTGEVSRFGETCFAPGNCGLEPGTVECDGRSRAGICSTEAGGSSELATPEACDQLDNDCDGQIDEGITWIDHRGEALPLGAACGVGACAGGEVVCNPNGESTCTSAVAGTGAFEWCNGLDDDCDGLTDESDGVALGCPSEGVCAQLVLESAECVGGELACRYEGALPYEPGEELSCNGRDDDCDGLTDEGFVSAAGEPLGAECQGRGGCQDVAGQVVCDGGVAVCSADLAGQEEICDGVDNDCDGETDEISASAIDTTCAAAGVCADYVSLPPACVEGDWRCPYVADPLWEHDESSCDGRDNDCDGETDEGTARTLTGAVSQTVGDHPPARQRWVVVQTPSGPVLYGGWGRGADQEPYMLGDAWRYDEATDTWRRLSPTGTPPPRAGHAMTYHRQSGLILVHGGFTELDAGASADSPLEVDGAPVDALWALDLAQNHWQLVGAVSDEGDAVRRRHHTLVSRSDGKLVLHGGLPAGFSASTSGAVPDTPATLVGTLSFMETPQGDVPVVTWSEAPHQAAWRYGHGAGAGDHFMAVAGGKGVASAQPPAVETTSATTDAPWSSSTPPDDVASERFFAGVAVAEDAVFIVAGLGESGALSDGWKIALSSGSWAPLSGVDAPRASVALTRTGGGGLRAMEGGAARATWALDPLQGSWGPPRRWQGPAPRRGARLVVQPDAEVIWLMAGHGDADNPLTDLWRTDSSGHWQAPVPGGATSPAAGLDIPRNVVGAVWNDAAGRLVLIGSAGDLPVSRLWSYDPVGATYGSLWPTGATPPLVSDAIFQVQASDPEVVWLFATVAGDDGGPRQSLYTLNLSEAAWSEEWAGEGGPTGLTHYAGGVSEGGVRVLSWGDAGGVKLWTFAGGAWQGPVAVPVETPLGDSLSGWAHDPSSDATLLLVASEGSDLSALWFDHGSATATAVALDGLVGPRRGLALVHRPSGGFMGFGGTLAPGYLSGGSLVIEQVCAGQ